MIMTVVHVAVVQLSIFCWCYQNDDDHNILSGDGGDAPQRWLWCSSWWRWQPRPKAGPTSPAAWPAHLWNFQPQFASVFFQLLMGLRGYLLLALLNLLNICRVELKLVLKLKTFGKDFQLVSVMVWIEHVLWFFSWNCVIFKGWIKKCIFVFIFSRTV